MGCGLKGFRLRVQEPRVVSLLVYKTISLQGTVACSISDSFFLFTCFAPSFHSWAYSWDFDCRGQDWHARLASWHYLGGLGHNLVKSIPDCWSEIYVSTHLSFEY